MLKNKSAFFAHISQKFFKGKHQVNISVNDDIVLDKEAANIFIREFAYNYSSATCLSFPSAHADNKFSSTADF